MKIHSFSHSVFGKLAREIFVAFFRALLRTVEIAKGLALVKVNTCKMQSLATLLLYRFQNVYYFGIFLNDLSSPKIKGNRHSLGKLKIYS